MRKKLLLTALLVAGASLATAQTVATKAPKKQASAAVEISSTQQEAIKSVKEQLWKQEQPKKSQNAFNISNDKSIKVLQSKKMKDGMTFQVVQDANERISKRIVGMKPLETVKSTKNYNKAQSNAAIDPSFQESFEGWDGIAKNWIPAEWIDESKVGSLIDDGSKNHDNRTWQTLGEETFITPSDGKYFAHVQFAMANSADTVAGNIPVTQDEWLISPAFTVKDASQNLYVDINYSPAWYLLNPVTYEFDGRYSNIEILIAKDGETKWTSLWNVIDNDALVNYTEDELWNDAMSMSHPWITAKVDLKDYANQKIKIAFRYTNKGGASGESAAIDAVRVTTPDPKALYNRPDGYLFFGLSQDYISSSMSIMFGPAYNNDTWLNYSNSDSESFEWAFNNPETYDGNITFTDINPSISYGYAQVDVPILTAKAKDFKNVYQWNAPKSMMQTGGTSIINFTDAGKTLMGAGNYDISQKLSVANFGAGAYCFGTGSDKTWGMELKSIANFFQKPTHKYVLNSMWINIMYFDADDDAEFTLTIRRVNDKGNLADTLTVSTAKASEIIKTDMGGENWYSLPFDFYAEDEDGFTTETSLEIESAIFVELKGFKSEKVRTFAPMNQAINSPIFESNCYAYFTKENKDGSKSTNLYNGSNLLIDFYSSFLFNMDATYSWLHTTNGDNQFDAPAAGGSKTFDMNSYYSTLGWWIDEDLPEWLDVTSSLETADKQTFTATVKELPAGTTGRKAEFTLATSGAGQKFIITQGNVTGIADVKVSAFKAMTVGDNFELSYPEGTTTVALMNVAGQILATYELPAGGKFTMPAANLSKGIYLMKFNSNETIKVIR